MFAFVVELEMEILDDVIGQELPAHRFHALARLVHGLGLQAHLDVFADADVLDLAESQRHQSLLHREALGVVDDGLGRDDDSGRRLHLSFRGLGGNRGLPTRRWYAVRYRSRVCATMSSGRRGGSDSLSQPDLVSQSRTNCLS